MRKYLYYLNSIFKLLTGIKNWFLAARVFLKLKPPRTPVVHIRKPPLRMKTRGAMDIWCVKETFLDRLYCKYGFEIGSGWQIIDIGAAIGDFTIFAALTSSENVVYAYEPFPESYALLEQNLELNHVSNVRSYPQAIGSQSGYLFLNQSSGEPLQFNTEMTFNPSQSISVPAVTLADAISSAGLEHCDLMKLDCEGAEYPILMSCPVDVFNKIERIVMEYHDIPRHHHKELVDFLKANGYQVETFPNPVHSNIGYLRAWRKTKAISG